jgi:fructose-1,6-bisphosphatase
MQPQSIHQRVPVILGSAAEVLECLKDHQEHETQAKH